MKPQKQLFRHKPQEGVYGDCHRTAIAIVLDMDAEDVPHFIDASSYDQGGGIKAHDRIEEWLNERGIVTISIAFPGGDPLEKVLDTIMWCNPVSKPVFILGGTSRTGCNHSVVACDGAVVCDPSLDDAGIIGPMDDGFYWVTFFGLLDATANPFRRRPAAAIEREKLEVAASALARILTVRGAHPEDFAITLGHGELHIYAPCHEAQWQFPKPAKVDGTPVEWHFGALALAREVAG